MVSQRKEAASPQVCDMSVVPADPVQCLPASLLFWWWTGPMFWEKCGLGSAYAICLVPVAKSGAQRPPALEQPLTRLHTPLKR